MSMCVLVCVCVCACVRICHCITGSSFQSKSAAAAAWRLEQAQQETFKTGIANVVKQELYRGRRADPRLLDSTTFKERGAPSALRLGPSVFTLS